MQRQNLSQSAGIWLNPRQSPSPILRDGPKVNFLGLQFGHFLHIGNFLHLCNFRSYWQISHLVAQIGRSNVSGKLGNLFCKRNRTGFNEGVHLWHTLDEWEGFSHRYLLCKQNSTSLAKECCLFCHQSSVQQWPEAAQAPRERAQSQVLLGEAQDKSFLKRVRRRCQE